MRSPSVTKTLWHLPGFAFLISQSLSLEADDLNPVRLKRAPLQAPVVLVENGQPKASISVMVPREKISSVLSQAVQDLREHIKLSTGAELPIYYFTIKN